MEHRTLVLERTYDHPAAQVFAAWANPAARAAWAPPGPGDVVLYDRAEFWVGGLDRSRCGPAGRPQVDVEARYLSIAEHERIVFSEVVAVQGRQLSAALVSVGLAPAGGGTRVTLTVQLASFSGPGIVEGNRRGWSAALDNLAGHLAAGEGGPAAAARPGTG